MQITLIPVRMDATLTLHRAGDVLTLNGVTFDFGPLPEGAMLPHAAIACDWFAGDVRRSGGELQLSLILPHGSGAPEATRYPDVILRTGDGPVDLPTWGPEPAPEDMA